jgi:hypothetical protein
MYATPLGASLGRFSNTAVDEAVLQLKIGWFAG